MFTYPQFRSPFIWKLGPPVGYSLSLEISFKAKFGRLLQAPVEFYSAGQLNSITTTLSLPLLKEKRGRKWNENGSRVEIRTMRLLNRYRNGQNKLRAERLVKFIAYY